MIFREATQGDVPFIIELLKASLGESMIPKSEKLWRWKHIENPFGESLVWVAEDGGKIVGVRAFMRWEFREEEKVYKALRAVDTAVHPAYQGRGIFSALTKKLADICQENGDHFIFNTPNKKSKPGYLKLGWKEIGKLPLNLSIHPLNLLRNNRKKQLFTTDWESFKYDANDFLSPRFSTNYSPAYFQWRYANCPLFQYGYHSDPKGALILYRIKKHGFGNELRITDIIPTAKSKKVVIRNQNKLIHSSAFASVTTSSTACQEYPAHLKNVNIGPMITVKNLNLDSTLYPNFQFSIGDLELF